MNDWYDRQGNPISMMDANTKMRNFDYKRVAYDELPSCRVSTVWLGLDHRFGAGEGPPIIFETLVLPSEWLTNTPRRSNHEPNA